MNASLLRIQFRCLMLALFVAGVANSQEPSRRLAKFQPEPSKAVYSGKGEEILVGEASCESCSECVTCGSCETPCCVGPVGTVWVHGEYLMWWAKGMATPPLVTAGPTGTLDDPTTVVLYGDDGLLEQMRSGFRVRMGTWLDCNRRWAIEGEYWRLGGISDSFSASSNAQGSPAIYRPFFNMNPRDENDQFDPPAREDVELVSFPNILSGTVTVDANSQLQGAGAWLRYNLCCESTPIFDCDPCSSPCSGPFGRRFDFLIGYRYVRLSDELTIRENLTSLRPIPSQGAFAITDSFGTTNDFHGVDLGMASEFNYGRWSLELLGRMALGNIQQQVEIAGQTTITGSQVSNGQYVGGLLAQRTNSGSHSRNEFAVLPQLGATLGYRLTPRLQATVGYSFMYLSRVVRPGDQIDLDVNPDLLAPEFTPFAGPLRPQFEFRDTDFWAQGMNFGLHFSW